MDARNDRRESARHGPITLDRVTVIVPTKNEAENIGIFLESLPATVHLMVVDASTDETPDIVERLRRRRTTVIREPLTIPEARQRGAELATTEWLIFTDADVVFDADYFEKLCQIEVAAEVGGIVGTKATLAGFDTYHRWFRRGQAALHRVGIPSATGSNMLLRRDVLLSIGGFDPALTVNEDTEVMFRVRRSEFAVDFAPQLIVRAFDHRRLEAGLARKIVHGAIRNTCLYFGIYEGRVRASDWGYWSVSEDASLRSDHVAEIIDLRGASANEVEAG